MAANTGKFKDRNPDIPAYGHSYKINPNQLGETFKDDRAETPKDMLLFRTVKEPGKRTGHIADPVVSPEKRLGKPSFVSERAGNLLKGYVQEDENPIPRSKSTFSPPQAVFGKPSGANPGAKECFSIPTSVSEHELAPGTQRRRNFESAHFDYTSEFGKPTQVDRSGGAIKTAFKWENQDESDSPQSLSRKSSGEFDDRIFGTTKKPLNRESTNSLMHMYMPEEEASVPRKELGESQNGRAFGLTSTGTWRPSDTSVTKKDNMNIAALITPTRLTSRGIHPSEMEKSRPKKEIRAIFEGVHGALADKDFERFWSAAEKDVSGELVSISAFQAVLGEQRGSLAPIFPKTTSSSSSSPSSSENLDSQQ